MTSVLKSRVIGTAIGVVTLGVIAGAVAGMGGHDATDRGAVTEEFSDQVEWVSVEATAIDVPLDREVLSGQVFVEAVIFGPCIGRVLIEDAAGNQVLMSPAMYKEGPGLGVHNPVRINLGLTMDGVRVKRYSNDRAFTGPVTIIYRRSLTGPARADVTTSNTNPGDPGYGRPDGVVDAADLTFFVEQWIGGPVA
ncbi:MAG: hypothetical protein AAGG07_12915 [Planctomycetota bacterium]